jgi:DNA-binding NarL/FixJ family response regulator
VGSEAIAAQPIRILLVDDDRSFLNSLEALLSGEPGLEIVGTAVSGHEALAAAARAQPDVVVIDVLMPAMSGIECAQLLQERYPNARVILISGRSSKTSDLTQTSAEQTPTWKRAKFPSAYTP